MNNLSVTTVLLIINVVVFAVGSLLEKSFNISEHFALFSIFSSNFQPYQFLTYMFLHANVFHIFSNMIGLWSFGRILEQTIGPKRFLILYFVCGVGAAGINMCVSYWEVQKLEEAAAAYKKNPNYDDFLRFIRKQAPEFNNPAVKKITESYEENLNNPVMYKEYQKASCEVVTMITNRKRDFSPSLVGASGAVMGVILAFALLYPNLEMMLMFPPMPVRAKYMIFFYIGIEIYAIYSNQVDDNVAHFAHIGGMIFALILIKLVWKMKVIQ